MIPRCRSTLKPAATAIGFLKAICMLDERLLDDGIRLPSQRMRSRSRGYFACPRDPTCLSGTSSRWSTNCSFSWLTTTSQRHKLGLTAMNTHYGPLSCSNSLCGSSPIWPFDKSVVGTSLHFAIYFSVLVHSMRRIWCIFRTSGRISVGSPWLGTARCAQPADKESCTELAKETDTDTPLTVVRTRHLEHRPSPLITFLGWQNQGPRNQALVSGFRLQLTWIAKCSTDP